MATNIIIDFFWCKTTNPQSVFANQPPKTQISLLHPKEEERQIGLETKRGLFLGPLEGGTGTGRGPPTSNCFSIPRGGLASSKKRKNIWNHDVEKKHLELWQTVVVSKPTPFLKICSSNWVHLPQFLGWTFQKYLSCHHLVDYWYLGKSVGEPFGWLILIFEKWPQGKDINTWWAVGLPGVFFETTSGFGAKKTSERKAANINSVHFNWAKILRYNRK